MKAHRLILPTLLGLALVGVLLFAAVSQSRAALETHPYSIISAPLAAQQTQPTDNPKASTRYVATSGADTGDCTNPASPCRTVQYAVDRAGEGDELRVAAGVYTDVNNYAGLSQVVYLTKTLTIQGGYTLTDWTIPDPIANPAVLDALGLGRVVFITGTVTPTLSGLGITGGQPSGIQITNASAVITGSQIYSNAVSGVRLDSYPAGNTAVTLERNLVFGNRTGIEAYYSSLDLIDNTIRDNGSPGSGMGAYLLYSHAHLQGNLFRGNQGGGGIQVQYSTATLISNTFIANSTNLAGGAVSISQSDVLLEANIVLSNTSGGEGGGIWVSFSSPTLRGNLISGNTAAFEGGGVYLLYSDALLVSNTFRNNSSGVMGGGLFSSYGSPHLKDNLIENNLSYYGGGALLTGSPLISPTITSNTFFSNTAQSIAGGLLLDYSTSNIEDNDFKFNSAGNLGGGIFLNNAPAILKNNSFISNTTDQGAGLYIYYSDATLDGNVIEGNSADVWAGGAYLLGSNATLKGNWILNNTANSGGSGLMLQHGNTVLTNNIIAENRLSDYGGGIAIDSSRQFYSPTLLIHNTIARNTGGTGSGVFLLVDTDVVLSNTILVSQTVGIETGIGNNTAVLEGTLWGSGAWVNGQDWAGDGTIITGTVNVWGEPGFIDPDNGDYHIGYGSAAWDAGVDAGVYTDIDGEARPVGAGFDIGADELSHYLRYVATSGADTGDCTNPASPCRTVQYAVDRTGEGDEVRVATGVYTDTHIRPRLDITTTGYVTQVVFISKTITLQGGYTMTNWTTPEPAANPTVLDAQGLGRGIYIAGLISPTVEGLQITGGDSTGLGGFRRPYSLWEEDVGGGIYIHGASATISHLLVISNTSPFYGGGIHLSYSTATIRNNSLEQNQTRSGGGGLFSYESNNTIIGNVFSSNLSILGNGGGLHLEYTTCEVTGNQIIANTALNGSGGGIHIRDSVIALKNNIIHGNSLPNSNGGGGINAESSDLVIEGNTVSGNYSYATGGVLLSGTNADIINNIIVDNDSLYNAAGIMIWSAEHINLNLHHNTIARNSGDVGAGVLVATGPVTLTNNIIVSQTVGIYSAGDANLEGTLWGSGIWANGQDWAGDGTIITGTINVWGDPKFIDPDNGDYHIGYGSAARDAGVDAGVYTDIDGEPRPVGAGFDIGADELQAALRLALNAGPDPVASGGSLTYTLIVTNSGAVDLHALITATLPEQVMPGGTVTWTATLPAPGGGWTETVVALVDAGYSGPLTGTLMASTLEGARGVISSTITAIQPVSGLTALNSSPTILGQSTAFTATVTAGSGISYDWDFGDGNGASGQVVTHTYLAAGTYTATVTASNAVSQGSAFSMVAVYSSEHKVFLPICSKQYSGSTLPPPSTILSHHPKKY